MKSKKGLSSPVIIIAVIAIVIAVGAYIAVQKGTNLNVNKLQPVSKIQKPVSSAIQNSNGLNTAEADLDNTNLDDVDSELNQIDADASTF